MNYMLDTNIVSYILNGMASEKLQNHLNAIDQSGEKIFISQITHAEIMYGFEKAGRPVKLLSRISEFLLNVEILDWDDDCVHSYAKIRAALSKQGITVQSMDLMIGAHAHALQMTLITNDHIFDHFKAFSLTVENWQN